MTAAQQARASLEILGKWRTLLTGWQLGTRPKGDAEGDAVRDHREATLLLRAEVSALTECLLESGVVTEEAYYRKLADTARTYSDALAARFPGFTAHRDGLHMDVTKAAETMKGWRP